MTGDGTQYEPGASAASGALLEEKVLQALRLREHLWTATAMWLVSDPEKEGQVLLDRESLLVAPVIGCYVCEEPYSRRTMQRRCSGKGHAGPAPLLPGGSRG